MALSFHIITARSRDCSDEKITTVFENGYDSLVDSLDPKNSDSLYDPDDEIYDWIREYFNIALGRKITCDGYALEVIREYKNLTLECLGSRLNIAVVNRYIKRT